MRKCRVDSNQAQIVADLRKFGAVVKHVHIVKNLFDIIVFYNGKTYCMEIKKDVKSKLTAGELQCKQDIESVNVKYHIVYSSNQAINILKNT